MKEMHTYKIDSKVSVVELAMDEKSGIPPYPTNDRQDRKGQHREGA